MNTHGDSREKKFTIGTTSQFDKSRWKGLKNDKIIKKKHVEESKDSNE